MSAQSHDPTARQAAVDASGRVTTMISCPNVRPMARSDFSADISASANENGWFDRVAFQRRWYANMVSLVVVSALLYGGVWIVSEFVRLQKVVSCFEAGRRDCLPLDMGRRTQSNPR